MSKAAGYIIAILGLLVIALSFGALPLKIPIPDTVKPAYIMVVGFSLVIIGSILSTQKTGGKAKHKTNEVPIYHKNKIVGYRREK